MKAGLGYGNNTTTNNSKRLRDTNVIDVNDDTSRVIQNQVTKSKNKQTKNAITNAINDNDDDDDDMHGVIEDDVVKGFKKNKKAKANNDEKATSTVAKNTVNTNKNTTSITNNKNNTTNNKNTNTTTNNKNTNTTYKNTANTNTNTDESVNDIKRKRKKTRSKQKNIKKDTRPLDSRPQYRPLTDNTIEYMKNVGSPIKKNNNN